MYLAPQNIPRAVSVLTLGNKVILYRIVRKAAPSRILDVSSIEKRNARAECVCCETRSVQPVVGRL